MAAECRIGGIHPRNEFKPGLFTSQSQGEAEGEREREKEREGRREEGRVSERKPA